MSVGSHGGSDSGEIKDCDIFGSLEKESEQMDGDWTDLQHSLIDILIGEIIG